MVKNLPASAADAREAGSIPGLGRFPGRGIGNPFQYSRLESSMGRVCKLWGRKESDITEQLSMLKA